MSIDRKNPHTIWIFNHHLHPKITKQNTRDDFPMTLTFAVSTRFWAGKCVQYTQEAFNCNIMEDKAMSGLMKKQRSSSFIGYIPK